MRRQQQQQQQQHDTQCRKRNNVAIERRNIYQDRYTSVVLFPFETRDSAGRALNDMIAICNGKY